ncbi:MAG: hypothetical protein AVDCRST_MAG10-854, partial [uncultured Acidimicrobiales bacterium]
GQSRRRGAGGLGRGRRQHAAAAAPAATDPRRSGGAADLARPGRPLRLPRARLLRAPRPHRRPGAGRHRTGPEHLLRPGQHAGPGPAGGHRRAGHGHPRSGPAAVPLSHPAPRAAFRHRPADRRWRPRRRLRRVRRRRDRDARLVPGTHAHRAAHQAGPHRQPGRAPPPPGHRPPGELAAHRRRRGQRASPAGTRPARRHPAGAGGPAHADRHGHRGPATRRRRPHRGARAAGRRARRHHRAPAGGHPQPVPLDPARPGPGRGHPQLHPPPAAQRPSHVRVGALPPPRPGRRERCLLPDVRGAHQRLQARQIVRYRHLPAGRGRPAHGHRPGRRPRLLSRGRPGPQRPAAHARPRPVLRRRAGDRVGAGSGHVHPRPVPDPPARRHRHVAPGPVGGGQAHRGGQSPACSRKNRTAETRWL